MDPSIILDYIPKQLLPSLGIPLVELFPDLCLGWWTPPSMKFNKYNRLKYLRIMLLIVAWYPVFELLFPIIDDSTIYSTTVIFALASIIVRPFLMEKQIQRVTSIGLWNAVLPKEKREALWIVVTNSKVSESAQLVADCILLVSNMDTTYNILFYMGSHLISTNLMSSLQDTSTPQQKLLASSWPSSAVNYMRNCRIWMTK